MDLIGVPVRITVGRKISEGQVELKLRTAQQAETLSIQEAADRLLALLQQV